MMYIPNTVTGGQLQSELRRVPVTVVRSDGEASESNLLEIAESVRSGSLRLVAVQAGSTLRKRIVKR